MVLWDLEYLMFEGNIILCKCLGISVKVLNENIVLIEVEFCFIVI